MSIKNSKIKTLTDIGGDRQAFDSSPENLRGSLLMILSIKGVSSDIRARLETELLTRGPRFLFQEGNIVIEANEVPAETNSSASPDA